MDRRRQWLVAGGATALVVAALGVAVAFAPPPITVGKPAADFRAKNIATGDTVSLSDYRGEVVLVNLWATWCDPCKAEMPEIQRLYEALKPLGFRVLAVSVDEEGSDVVKAWVDERHLTFDVLHDQSGAIENLYQAVGLPESFVIDRQGRIVKRVTGWTVHWDDAVQMAFFRRLLERKPES